MLKAIVQWSLHMRVLVVALAAVLMFFGIRAVQHAPLDVFPEFAPPLVEIQTEAPGLSTEEVDALVTVPLENALNGLPWLKTIRSKSVLGLSSVVMIFQTGTDLVQARQLVQERLALAQTRLPSVIKPPVLMAPYSSLSRVLKVGLSSETLSQMELSELALWTIRPRLMSVPGVANVAIWGQRDKQYQVLVDPERLRAAGVTLDAVVKAAGDAAVLGPGGFMDTPNQRLAVRQLGVITSADDLARSIVAFPSNAPIRLGDVAQVVVGHPAPIGDAVINDGPGILLIVEKQPWGNTLDVTRGVEKVLAELKRSIPAPVLVIPCPVPLTTPLRYSSVLAPSTFKVGLPLKVVAPKISRGVPLATLAPFSTFKVCPPIPRVPNVYCRPAPPAELRSDWMVMFAETTVLRP